MTVIHVHNVESCMHLPLPTPELVWATVYSVWEGPAHRLPGLLRRASRFFVATFASEPRRMATTACLVSRRCWCDTSFRVSLFSSVVFEELFGMGRMSYSSNTHRTHALSETDPTQINTLSVQFQVNCESMTMHF